MSYLTGTVFNFEERLHQSPTGIYDLNLYYYEVINSGYTGLSYITKDTKNDWNREFIKKGQIFHFPTGITGLFP